MALIKYHDANGVEYTWPPDDTIVSKCTLCGQAWEGYEDNHICTDPWGIVMQEAVLRLLPGILRETDRS